MQNAQHGSDWNKWDLHVHTPASVLFQDFKGTWDDYFKSLIEQAMIHDVKAIGITDYFSVEGYKKIRSEYLENDSKLQDLFAGKADHIAFLRGIKFFPNIEFRLKKFIGQNKVNFHVIFSDEVSVADIEANFLSRLTFEFDTNESGKVQQLALTVSNLERLGAKLKKEHANFKGTNLFEGMNNTAIDEDDIIQVLHSQNVLFKNKYLLVVEAEEDLSKLSWDGQDHQARKQLIKKANGLFARNKNSIAFGLGQKHASVPAFLSEFGSLKPSFKCCDAHSIEKFFVNSGGEYTWIKSEISFNGLSQVLLEPLSRLRISAVRPDEKNNFSIIHSARFVPKATANIFPPDPIFLNPNLNSIIGGKSSGKSLLLYHLAKTINPKIAHSAFLEKEEPYESLIENGYDFEVQWRDGHIDRLSAPEESRSRQLVYIPQLYINTLVEKEQRSELNSLISGILDQNDSFYQKKQRTFKGLAQTNLEMQKNLKDFFSLTKHVDQLKENLEKLGQKTSIEVAIKKIEEDIQALAKQSNLSDDEYKLITDLGQQQTALGQEVEALKIDISKFERFKASSEPSEIVEGLKGYLQEKIDENDDITFEETAFKIEAEKIRDRIATTVLAALEGKNFFEVIEQSRKVLTEKNKKFGENQKILAPLIEKIKFTEKIKQLTKSKEELSATIVKINNAELEVKKETEIRNNTLKGIYSLVEKRSSLYEQLIKELSEENVQKISPELFLDAKIVFKESNFIAKCLGLLDKRSLKSVLGDRYDDETQQIKDCDLFATKRSLFSDIFQKKIRVRAGSTVEEACLQLFADYYTIDFDLIYKGDNLQKMSPGKRGLVILQLILEISNSKDPILIDQPEDNLDNRTIYIELAGFLRGKRSSRQIILVTHNANMVVGTDSELVVVANQDGQSSARGNRQHKFEFLTGPLEHSIPLDETQKGILFQMGVREHVCDILEGGEEAFRVRQKKYSL